MAVCKLSGLSKAVIEFSKRIWIPVQERLLDVTALGREIHPSSIVMRQVVGHDAHVCASYFLQSCSVPLFYHLSNISCVFGNPSRVLRGQSSHRSVADYCP
jgi:hypothetical protein